MRDDSAERSGLSSADGVHHFHLTFGRDMSIYASLEAPNDDEHLEGCAIWVVVSEGVYEYGDEPCDCGRPDAPLVYKGSHVVPTEQDERGGWVDLALIPGHIRHPDIEVMWDPDMAPLPFLRFGVNEETVVLTRHNVEMIHKSLSIWLQLTDENGWAGS
jgi:hypothetical protein